MNVTHRAKWLLLSPDRIIENGYVTVCGDRIIESGCGKGTKGTLVEDHGTGVLMPALVNAHTHLDLTPLEGTISPADSFMSWVEEVIKGKAGLMEDEVFYGILKGRRLLRQSGCILAGDHRSFSVRDNAPKRPFVRVFHEYLGADFQQINLEDSDVLSSLAAHAPHTTAPVLIQHLKELCRERNLVLSMHVAESLEEREFITTGKGNWAHFLVERGIRFEGWDLPAPSPVRHLEKLGVLDENTMAIHLLQVDKKDLEVLAEKKVRVCLCPRSNRRLTGRLPDIHGILDVGIQPALGTDSLASVPSLNLFDEMNFVAQQFPALSPQDILAMGTVNGARALGLDKEWGSLDTGKQSVMLFIPMDAPTPASLLEKLVLERVETPLDWVT